MPSDMRRNISFPASINISAKSNHDNLIENRVRYICLSEMSITLKAPRSISRNSTNEPEGTSIIIYQVKADTLSCQSLIHLTRT